MVACSIVNTTTLPLTTTSQRYNLTSSLATPQGPQMSCAGSSKPLNSHTDGQVTLGYFDGSQQAKVWLYSMEDLIAMYSKYPKGGAINLWCDGEYDVRSHKRKRDTAVEQSSHRKAKEDKSESAFVRSILLSMMRRGFSFGPE